MNPEPMTDNQRVAEIEARLEAISCDGHWKSDLSVSSRPQHQIVAFNSEYDSEDVTDSPWPLIAKEVYSNPDATFIAHAPSDIRFLLSALRTAEQALAEATRENERLREAESDILSCNLSGAVHHSARRQ